MAVDGKEEEVLKYLKGFGETCRCFNWRLHRVWASRLCARTARGASCVLYAAGNEFESEALPGALPKDQNNPRVRPESMWVTTTRTWLPPVLPLVYSQPSC